MKAAKEQREKADSRRGWGARKKAQGKKKKKTVRVDKEGQKVCVVGNNKKDSQRGGIFILI